MKKIVSIILLGPTASGKSEISIKLAKNLNGEILNADAMQIYKGLDIGTGKLEEEEWCGIEHHLISFLEPQETFSAGKYRIEALKIINKIKEKGKIPIIVGGTGFYISALLRGLAPIPDIPKRIRDKLNNLISIYGLSYFHKILSFTDPYYSKKISCKDRQRIERALEVIFYTGIKFSKYFEKNNFDEDSFENIKIGLFLDKEELKKRISERISKMIEKGWLGEVKRLMDLKISKDTQCFKSIGYREIMDVLDGKLSLEEAKKIIIKKTIAYAKRQMTWFKKEKDIYWIKANDLELAFFSALRYYKEKTKGEEYVN